MNDAFVMILGHLQINFVVIGVLFFFLGKVCQGFFPFNLCKNLHFFVASHIKSTYSY
jgi:hypothetical protein